METIPDDFDDKMHRNFTIGLFSSSLIELFKNDAGNLCVYYDNDRIKYIWLRKLFEKCKEYLNYYYNVIDTSSIRKIIPFHNTHIIFNYINNPKIIQLFETEVNTDEDIKVIIKQMKEIYYTTTPDNLASFTINYNILRIMSGLGGVN